MKKTTSAFTIVELLIVIVVIGVLAAITIVAFNGVQARAEKAKTVSAVSAYVKHLQNYKTANGSFPTTGAFCLGEDYPVLSAGNAGCRTTTSVIANTTGATDRNTFKTFIGGQLPMPSTKILYDNAGTVGYSGIYFYGSASGFTLNGTPVALLAYTIEDTTCPVGPVYSASGNPNFTGSPVTRTVTVSSTASLCYMMFPLN